MSEIRTELHSHNGNFTLCCVEYQFVRDVRGREWGLWRHCGEDTTPPTRSPGGMK